jgi:hypothetical protein
MKTNLIAKFSLLAVVIGFCANSTFAAYNWVTNQSLASFGVITSTLGSTSSDANVGPVNAVCEFSAGGITYAFAIDQVRGAQMLEILQTAKLTNRTVNIYVDQAVMFSYVVAGSNNNITKIKAFAISVN